MTVISAWSKVSDLANGELWAYPEISESGAFVTVRVVTDGKVIDWALAPDEAEMLMAILKKVADRDAPTEAPRTLEEKPDADGMDILEPFVRQEPQQARPASTLGEKIEGVLDKFRA